MAITATALKYNMPRWFVYCVAQRESSFNPNATNTADGGVGLCQLTSTVNNGKPYPYNLALPNNSFQSWIYDKGLNKFGPWINMVNVFSLSNAFDVAQNISRYFTVYAIPWYLYQKSIHPTETPNQLLDRVGFHWFHGVFHAYDPTETSYMGQFRSYISLFRAPCEVDDGIWDGKPNLLGIPVPTPVPDPTPVPTPAPVEDPRITAIKQILPQVKTLVTRMEDILK